MRILFAQEEISVVMIGMCMYVCVYVYGERECVYVYIVCVCVERFPWL